MPSNELSWDEWGSVLPPPSNPCEENGTTRAVRSFGLLRPPNGTKSIFDQTWEEIKASLTPEEKDELLLDDHSSTVYLIQDNVNTGLRSKEKIVSCIEEWISDEEDDPERLKELLVLELDQAWERRLKQERSWPAEVSGDRLQRAFEQMEAVGIVARMDFQCCGSCGYHAISQEVAPGADPLGFVFFNEQSTDQLVSRGDLYLYNGSFDKDPSIADEVCREVNVRVKRILEANGFTVEVGEDLADPLKIVDVYWQCRLPVEDE